MCMHIIFHDCLGRKKENLSNIQIYRLRGLRSLASTAPIATVQMMQLRSSVSACQMHGQVTRCFTCGWCNTLNQQHLAPVLCLTSYLKQPKSLHQVLGIAYSGD